MVSNNPLTSPLFPRPRVAVVGVGAIGVVIADALSASADVLLCRRGTANPMTLARGDDEHVVAAAVWSDPAEAAPVDWIVLATKAQDTPSTGDWFAALVGPGTRVVVAQNGIDHAERVAEWVPAERVVPTTVYIAAERTGADSVRLREVTSLVVPSDAGGEAFAALMNGALPVVLDEDFRTSSWRKLVMNAALNSITALTLRTNAVTKDAEGRQLFTAAIREGLAVAEAVGVDLGPRDFHAMMTRLDALPGEASTSMLQDNHANKRLEHEHLTGALVRAGRQVGVPTPTLSTLDSLLSAINTSRASRQVAAAA